MRMQACSRIVPSFLLVEEREPCDRGAKVSRNAKQTNLPTANKLAGTMVTMRSDFFIDDDLDTQTSRTTTSEQIGENRSPCTIVDVVLTTTTTRDCVEPERMASFINKLKSSGITQKALTKNMSLQ